MDNLYNQLSSGSSNVWNIVQQWRQLWEQSKRSGSLSILQLCIDMSGFSYTLNEEDLVLLDGNINALLEDNIFRAHFDCKKFIRDGIFISNFQDFLQNLIVRPWQEILAGNEWLNKTVRLLVAFCSSDRDECIMAGAYFASIMLLNLCKVQHDIKQTLERPSLFRNAEEQVQLKKICKTGDNICLVLLESVKPGFAFVEILIPLTDHICKMLTSYPSLLIKEYKQLELLDEILSLKSQKTTHTVLKYLKSHFIDTTTSTITRDVGRYILSRESVLICIMGSLKSTESVVLQLLYHACRVTESTLSDQASKRIALSMFSTNETAMNAAIDLFEARFVENVQARNVEDNIIMSVVEAYGQYEYPLTALQSLIEKIWQKRFFQQFDDLFLLLKEVLPLEDGNRFGAKTIAYMITFCHQLLMADIKAGITPPQNEPAPVNWSTIRMRLDSFVSFYPECLTVVFEDQNVFKILLTCLNPEDKELYSVAGVNCEQYYIKVLYNTLSPVASKATDYTTLLGTLTAIYRFDTIVHVSEDIWGELTKRFYTVFFHTRSRLRRYNVGIDKKLMEDYTASITQLCVLLEINNSSYDVFTLAEYLAKDLRLLKKMNLSENANAIFYRLYKNTLFAQVASLLQNHNYQFCENGSDRFGKQVQAFIIDLCAQLDANGDDVAFDVSKHIVSTVCDMLLLTEPFGQNPVLKKILPTEFTVEQELLEKLAKYAEQTIFSATSDVDTSLLSEKKLLLTSFNKLYSKHSSLPRLTDTRHIVKHYGVNTLFSIELEALLNIVYSKSPEAFHEIVTSVFFEYILKKGCYFKAKVFLNHIQTFHGGHLGGIVEMDEYCFNVARSIGDRVFEQYFSAEAHENKMISKIFTLLKPWVEKLSKETRTKLRQLFRNHPCYISEAGSKSGVVTMTKKFLQSLKA
ncbi:uncharacterized protein LOC131293287 [Anopheles ziemanni]|uniref:uncharacterized protein LOC131267398 n=1 Tax=Anopheles coustani TaxID=139045 RepID=UPI00265A6F3E|nr:uncharacterized protein LOC131267398 [Anopheles coustani]XP_058177350.1 uncharacterized protein LOC131293287 [Anopheles ziemanni]